MGAMTVPLTCLLLSLAVKMISLCLTNPGKEKSLFVRGNKGVGVIPTPQANKCGGAKVANARRVDE